MAVGKPFILGRGAKEDSFCLLPYLATRTGVPVQREPGTPSLHRETEVGCNLRILQKGKNQLQMRYDSYVNIRSRVSVGSKRWDYFYNTP